LAIRRFGRAVKVRPLEVGPADPAEAG
jgi:hypothetical protein